MFWTILIRSIVAAAIGWIVGTLLSKIAESITFAYDNRRLKRAAKKQHEKNSETFGLVYQLGQRR